jgi:hypothetical protein
VRFSSAALFTDAHKAIRCSSGKFTNRGLWLGRFLKGEGTLRAKIVLALRARTSNAVVATRLGVGPHTIGKWRKRFIADRIEGLYDEMRSAAWRFSGFSPAARARP